MKIRRLATAVALIASAFLVHGENIVLTPTSSNIWLLIQGGTTNKSYDIFTSTNLASWQLKAQGTLGQTNFVFDYIPFATNGGNAALAALGPPPPPGGTNGPGGPFINPVAEFFRWGSDQDSDGDGFTDAYEVIILRRSPHSTNTPTLTISNPTGEVSTPIVEVIGSFTEHISGMRFITELGESSGRITSQVWVPASSNNWVGSYVSAFSGKVSLRAGTNQVTVIVTDDWGNSFSAPTVYVYTPVPDTASPTMLSMWPGNGSTVVQTNFIIHGALDDTSGTVIISNATTGAEIPASIMGSYFTAEISMTEGPNTIGILSTDAAGNQSWSFIDVNCDTMAPTAVVNGIYPCAPVGPQKLCVYGTLRNTTNATVTVNGVVITNVSESWRCEIPATGQPIMITTTPSGSAAPGALAASSSSTLASYLYYLQPEVRLTSVSLSYYDASSCEWERRTDVNWNDSSGGRVVDYYHDCVSFVSLRTWDVDEYGLDRADGGTMPDPLPRYFGHATYQDQSLSYLFRGSAKFWTGGWCGSSSTNLWCIKLKPVTYWPRPDPPPIITPNFSIAGKNALISGRDPWSPEVFILDLVPDNAVVDMTPHHKDNHPLYDTGWPGYIYHQPVEFEIGHSIFGPGLSFLSDHPAGRGSYDRLRSPRFVFGKDDYIQFRVFGIPPGMGDNFLQVRVTSESDTTGVLVNLNDGQAVIRFYEPPPGTPCYMNIAEAGELLYLSNASSEGPRDTIKVLEEEVLTFKLFYRDAHGRTTFSGLEQTVMVDRGEFSVAGIAEYASDHQKYREEMQKARVNWWQVGYRDDINTLTNNPNHLAEVETLKNMIRDGGADPLTFEGQADFPYAGTHGDYDGLTGSFGSTDGGKYFDIEDGRFCRWGTDVEFAYIDTCNVLHWSDLQWDITGDTRDGYVWWTQALFGSPRPAHMVLSHWYQVNSPQLFPFQRGTGTSAAICDDFFDEATTGNGFNTIIEAWYLANTSGTRDQECAVVAHSANVFDRLKQVTRDTHDPAMKYFWFEPGVLEGTFHEQPFMKAPTRMLESVEMPEAREVEMVSLQRVPTPDLNTQARTARTNSYGLAVFKLKPESELSSNKVAQVEDARIALAPLLGILPENAIEGNFREGGFNMTNPAPKLSDVRIKGKVVAWENYNDGAVVLGDLVSVVVLEEQPRMLKHSWHRVRERHGVRTTLPPEVLLPSVRAKMLLVGATHITEVVLGYLPQAGQAVPVWKFKLDGPTTTRYVLHDALTGDAVEVPETIP